MSQSLKLHNLFWHTSIRGINSRCCSHIGRTCKNMCIKISNKHIIYTEITILYKQLQINGIFSKLMCCQLIKQNQDQLPNYLKLGMVELCAKNLQIMRNDFTDYARTFCQLCALFANYAQIMRAHNRIIQRFHVKS